MKYKGLEPEFEGDKLKKTFLEWFYYDLEPDGLSKTRYFFPLIQTQ